MTENEAKQKWCPMARWTHTNVVGPSGPEGTWNRESPYENHARCLGSGCMAWQWFEPAWKNERGQLFSVDSQFEKRELVQEGGYCGLAGTP